MSAMQSGPLSWQPLQPFGAEIAIDLRQPLSAAECAHFRELLFEHEVLRIRKQQLTHPQQIAVMEYIEPVLRIPEFVHFISTDARKGALGTQALPFHSDLSFAEKLRLGISLHGVDLVDGGSTTRFASSTRPLAKLSPSLRARLCTLKALHVFPWGGYGTSHTSFGARHLQLDPPDWAPRHAHPVILAHPVTARPVLYLNEMLTSRVLGLSRDESSALLKELFALMYAPDNVLEHVWHNGDLVVWDNVAAQHARGDLLSAGPRTLQKVQLGRLTLEEQWPKYSAEEMRKALQASPDAGL